MLNRVPFQNWGDINGMALWAARHTKTVLVCGSRDFNKHSYTNEQVKEKLTELSTGYLKDYFIVIVNGFADGVDITAAEWAEENKVPFFSFPADWEVHLKKAGFYRNQLMLTIAKPDIVVAFPGNNGTKDMKERAHKANIEVIEIDFE